MMMVVNKQNHPPSLSDRCLLFCCGGVVVVIIAVIAVLARGDLSIIFGYTSASGGGMHPQKFVSRLLLHFLLSMQEHSFNPTTTAPTATTTTTTSRRSNSSNENTGSKDDQKMSSSSMSPRRILCLHGKFQSGAAFANKIAGARRKLERSYELHFLDAPIELPSSSPFARSWWLRDDDTTGRHLLVDQAMDHVQRETAGRDYCAILGLSQGGTLATALAVSGTIPGIRAVVTAGAPDIDDVWECILQEQDHVISASGLAIPKLHLAGTTDDMVPPASTRQLCERGGNGTFVLHEKGHLFPTKAAYVNQIMDFLQQHVGTQQQQDDALSQQGQQQ